MASTATQILSASVMDIRPLNDRTRQEYLNSFGSFSHTVGPFGRWKLWNVVDRVNQIWSELEVQIVELLQAKASEIRPPRRYRGPKDPCHVLRCYMVGLNQAHASPHVAIFCDQKWLCTQVKAIVLTSGLLQERGWAGFLKLPAEIRQPGGTLSDRPGKVDTPGGLWLDPTYAGGYGDKKLKKHNVAISLPSDPIPKTLCGIRIAVSGANGLVNVATLGGIVEVDGELYGLTASHALLFTPPSNDNSESEADASIFDFDEDDLDPSLRPLNPAEASGIQNRQAYAQTIKPLYSSAPEDALTSSPTEPVSPEMEYLGQLTRKDLTLVPDSVSLRDVTNEPPNLPAMSWTPASLKMFGNSSVHDFQWVLLSISLGDVRMARNVNEFYVEGLPKRLHVASVADIVVSDGRNVCLATTRGAVFAAGISSISPIKFAFSREYLHLETIQLDRAVEGDCGSWALDASSGELLGMLVASCDIAREAYILPARKIFAEITRVSGKSVGLPSSKAVDRLSRVPLTTLPLTTLETKLPYKPLRGNEIRVVTVLPGAPESLIESYLSIRNLEDPGQYEALSYAWETWTPSSSINLHHQSVQVTSSLSSALRFLRYHDKPRHLWVDAICINQQDAAERGIQVALMADIMQKATEVCIWLGEEDEDSQRAFSSYSLLQELHDFRGNSLDDTMSEQVIALSSLVKRPWFHRRWCLQDVCGAKKATLYCGTYSMPWATLANTITLLRAYQIQYEDFSLTLDQSKVRRVRDPSTDLVYFGAFVEVVSNVFRKTDKGVILDRIFSLETIVSRLPWLNVAIPHDSIYSVLSLAKFPVKSYFSQDYRAGAHSLSASPMVRMAAEAFLKPLKTRRKAMTTIINVDYSTSFQEVCKDFICTAIHESSSLDIVCRPWAPAIAGLPSWVTTVAKASTGTTKDKQFVRLNADALVGHSGPDSPIRYEASGPSRPSFSFDTQRLCVKGFILDTVYDAQSPALMGNIPPSWMKLLGRGDKSTPPAEEVWRLLVANRGPHGHLPPMYYQIACQVVFENTQSDHGLSRSERFTWLSLDYGININQQLTSSSGIVREFLDRMQSVVWGRRLIKTTAKGLLGLAPGGTKISDVVAILYGCSVPVILREVPNSSSDKVLYKLIGECYIDRMMYGQALDEKVRMDIKTQTFIII